MYKVAIVGSGQLGSRHLQGLLKTEFPISIDIVDSSEESLKLAKSRASEIVSVTNSSSIRYLSSIKEMDDDIDLCIIATSSNVRLQVLELLLNEKKVKNIVLEKVLFQSLDEYYIAEKLINDNNINCWVNCPRPMFDVYKNIKSKIFNYESVTYTAIGGDWGLACNAIHFIDHLSYLTNQTNFLFDHSGITSIVESNRKGFVEFTGTFVGKLVNNGSEIFLHSRGGSNVPLKIEILTDHYSWKINEIAGKMIESCKKNNWREQEFDINVPYQSELSNKIATQILLEGKCELTSYKKSMNLHIDMLSSFLDFYNSKNIEKTNICPIT
jgi:hypothetical protein